MPVTPKKPNTNWPPSSLRKNLRLFPKRKIQKNKTKTSLKAKLGVALSEGDKVETGEGSRIELKLYDGSIIRIGENSSMVFEELKEDAGTMTDVSTIKVLFGRIWLNVKKTIGRKQESKIVTPKVTAAVKGTAYRSDVDKEGETNVNVYDGTVNVSKEGQEVTLSKLEQVTSKDLTKNPFDEAGDERDEWVRWNKSRDKLRVAMIFTETKGGAKMTVPTSEITMAEAFLGNYLFSVVDQAQIDKIREGEKLKAALKGDAAAAAAAGLEIGADMVVIGEATTDAIDSGLAGGMITGTANLVAKVIKTDTAEILGVGREPDRKVDLSGDTAVSLALVSTSKKLSAKLIDDIVKKWKEEARKGGTYDISVTNVTFEKLNVLQQVLATIADKNNVEKLAFTSTRALLNMAYVGDSATLAGKIAELEFKGFKVEVVGMTAYKVELEIKENK